MYIATSSNNHDNTVSVSWERTSFVQITNLTFYFNSFTKNDVNLRALGCFKIRLLLEGITWSTRYNISENDGYSDSSTDWTLVSLNFALEIYGIEIIFDEVVTTHADMCFSNITITYSFQLNESCKLF